MEVRLTKGAAKMSNTIKSVEEVFGSNVFNDVVMRERLGQRVYNSFKRTVGGHEPLDSATADIIANAMKDWAVEKGATHYCHWFQPLTGLTAEKHDSFISPTSEGQIVMEFSGRELIQSEPDASSFPSGGLRATFEARGYTAWDCTSPVFIKEDGRNITLCIPSAFCSYTGDALDKKTPLLRSMDVLNEQALRILRIFGNESSSRVDATCGAEQEYFLIDRAFFQERLDLMLTGRTLFGAAPPRGQEMEDHYFGTLQERVASFMNELNIELWKLGVSAKTQHSEVAPAQYELAPVFATVNVATDHNQLTMETLQKVALRHDLVCLLHEKPFAGVNGSGKHNNWSLLTDDGINLLEPGKTPHDNMVFLVFLCSVIRAVDKYAGVLRSSVANTGNEHRLGGHEAPPAIVSIFLGDQLTDVFEQLANGGGNSYQSGVRLELGVTTLPPLPKDCTDRNRTSPFAFTGNKFEFRMVGSSQSVASPNIILNTIVADVLAEIADELEAAGDTTATAKAILKKIANQHRRIIFNGDNYSQEWLEEAKKRGLANMASSVEALCVMTDEENIRVFERRGVLTRTELAARTDILLDAYSKMINIEALTMLNIARRQIRPAATEYSAQLAEAVNQIKAAGVKPESQKVMLEKTCGLIDALCNNIEVLQSAVGETAAISDSKAQAASCRDNVIKAMENLRNVADKLEMIVSDELWPLPTYAEMLFIM